MREIKFRFRFELQKEMTSGDGIKLDKIQIRIYTIKEIISGIVNIFLENMEAKLLSIDEFTGLSDKNGKMIFEGDIVKFPDDWQVKEHIIKVPDIYYSKEWGIDYDCCEVIGNVKENPELLTK